MYVDYSLLNNFPNKNYIINGDFQVWQRGTSFTHTGSSAYFCDRWFGRRGVNQSGMTISKQWDDVYKNICRVQRDEDDTQSGDLNLAQIINSDTIELLAGKTITVSAWIKLGNDFSDTDGQLVMNLRTGTVKDEGGNPYGFTTGSALIGTTSSSTTKGVWQKLTITATLNSNVKSFLVHFLANNMQGTAGADDYFEVANVKVELGSVASEFEPNDYNEELKKCKVYFERILENEQIGNGFVDTTTTSKSILKYIKKRIVPSISYSSATCLDVIKQGTSIQSSGVSFTNIQKQNSELTTTVASGLVASEGIYNKIRSSEYIDIDAEI